MFGFFRGADESCSRIFDERVFRLSILNNFLSHSGFEIIDVEAEYENDQSKKDQKANSTRPRANTSKNKIEEGIKSTKRPSGSTPSDHRTRLLDKLITVLKQQRSGVSSEQVIDMFQDEVKNEDEKYVFRQMLQRVASLSSVTRKWTLRQSK